MNTLSLTELSVCELSFEDQHTIIGGGFAEDLGYAVGYLAGFAFTAGPRLILSIL